MSPHDRARRSFTLVELLVAAAVSVIVLLVLAQVLGTVSRTWAAGRQLSDNLTKGRAAVDLIFRDLSLGVFRSDTPAFVDENGQPADVSANYAFYATRITSGSRALSLIDYCLTTSATSSDLQRGAMPIDYSGTTLMPFGTTSIASLTQLKQDSSNFQEVATGVVAFRFFFLHNLAAPNSSYYSLDYLDNGTNRATALGVTLAALDDNSEAILQQQGKLGSLLSSPAFAVPNPLLHGLKYTWEQNLNTAGFFNAYPRPVASGLKIFERMIYLPPSSP